MNKDIKLIMEDGKVLSVQRNITVADLLKKINDTNVVTLRINGKVVPTDYEIASNSIVTTVTVDDRIGRKIYMKGLQFMYLFAIYELFGSCTNVIIKHSLDKAIYTEFNLDKPINYEVVKQIKKKMRELASSDIPIRKISSTRDEVMTYFGDLGEQEKVLNYKFMPSDYVSLYELGDIYNYFYSFMPASTGILSRFDLTFVEPNGIVLSYPVNGKVPKYNDSPKVLESFKSYDKRLESIGINYAGDVNKVVTEGKISDFIQINEYMYDDNINELACKIANNKKIKAIYISGPSSSGKTTTSKKLALSLKTKGIDSLVLSTDDYYLNRVDSPKDENGEYDFEVIDALDTKLFNTHMNKLLKGEEVVMPTFNFITGEKEYKNKPTSLKKNQLLIVEGLHAVNEKMNSLVDKKNKLKVYLSPFSPINLDRHNHISTTDIRLIRRIVRDYRSRGYSAEVTMKKWLQMRKSEENNVYPYQREVDTIINTSLAYEIGVIRTYVEPLLYTIEPTSTVYEEAIRLLHFLKGFMNIPSDDVPKTSVLREFIGNGYYE